MSDVRCVPGNLDIESTGRFRTRYLYRAPAEHTVEEVLAPHYFGGVIAAKGFRELDQIEVEWADGTKWGLLQIRAVEPAHGFLQTKERIAITVDDDCSDLPSGWDMEHQGDAAKWVIKHDGVMREGGFATPEKARNRIYFLASEVRQREVMAGTMKRKSRETEKVA